MKRVYVMLGLSLVAMGFLLAQSDADFSGWMKTVAAKNKSLKANIAAKSADASVDAKALEGAFKQVEDFWSKRGAADAVNFAKSARTAAAAIPAAVAAGDFATAGTHAATIGGTCQGCHGAHRDKGADGAYTIK